MIEPEAKNTAPAILAAALFLENKSSDAIVLVTPSDHVIEDTDAFNQCVSRGLTAVNDGQIVTFGIKPTRPETGYGYLEVGEKYDSKVQNLRSFIEKPTENHAKEMIKSGNYLWNSGIFLFRASDIIQAFEKYAASILSHVRRAVSKGKNDLNFFRLGYEDWSKCDNISIDYAILEKVDNLAVVHFNGLWSDLGSWNSIWKEQTPDENGLVLSKNVSAIDCKDSLFRSEAENLHLVGLGVKDIIAIAMPDAVLVADKNRAQDVKGIVENLKTQGIGQAEAFPKEHRPWGWFEVLAADSNFKVKRIFVEPKASLSLQSHKYRSEHWVVVRGKARTTIDSQIRILVKLINM